MLRIAAACLCIAGGQVLAWALHRPGATGSLAWPALFAATAVLMIAGHVLRAKRETV